MSVQNEDRQRDALHMKDLERLGEQLPGGFFIYRADGSQELLYANEAMLHIFGCGTEEELRQLTGGSFRGLVHPEDLERIERSIREQIADSANENLDYVEYRILRRDGEVRWVEDHGRFAHIDGFGGVYYVFISDITEKRRAQDERFRAELELEREKRANEIKSALLRGVSFDIRDPMGAIAKSAHQARAHLNEPDSLQNDLDSVDAAALRLQRLVDDLLRTGTAEFGRVDLRLEPCSLVDEIRYVASLFRAQAEHKGVTLTEDLELPNKDVLADTQCLRGILSNLIGNAVNIVPEGGVVTVLARQQLLSEGSCVQYKLSVADNGAGMSEEVLRKVREALEAEEPPTPEGDETIHGLAVVKKLAELMGGTLSVESREGEGSTLTVLLPLALAEHNRAVQFDSLFDLFSLLAGAAPVYLHDLHTHEARFSPALLNIIGMPEDRLATVNGLYYWADYIHPDDRERFMHMVWDTVELKHVSFDIKCRMRIKSGVYYPVRFLGSVTRDLDGYPDFLGMVMKNDDLSELADPITGLPNFHRFLLALQEPSENASAVLLIRLGMLGKLNEAYGYSCGSEVMRRVGELICNTVGERAQVFRLEGAEFAVLSDLLGEQEMSALYEMLRVALRDTIETDGVVHHLVASGGLLIRSPLRELSEAGVRDYLTEACNESERMLGGGLVTIHEDGTEGPDAPAVTRAIRRSMARDFENFFLLYQPVFSPGADRPIGAEALLRWKDGEFGEIRPGRFLPEIEQEDEFRELGYWILRSAMTDGAQFLSAAPGFTVCVNVAPQQVADACFAERVASLAKETGFPLDHLLLEISQECQLLPTEVLSSFAEPLRALGIKLGVDDFGSGGAWLDALKALRADYVKFSAAFTSDIAHSDAEREAVRHLSELARTYRAEVFFKAVESEETANALAKLTVHGAQGWFFSEAVYFDEILAWIGTEDGM